MVHGRGHVVVVDAGAEERHLAARVDVPRGELLEMRGELRLRERGLEVELPAQPHPLRNVAEQLVDAVDADRREHLLAVGVRQREVAHCSPSSCW